MNPGFRVDAQLDGGDVRHGGDEAAHTVAAEGGEVVVVEALDHGRIVARGSDGAHHANLFDRVEAAHEPEL